MREPSKCGGVDVGNVAGSGRSAPSGNELLPARFLDRVSARRSGFKLVDACVDSAEQDSSVDLLSGHNASLQVHVMTFIGNNQPHASEGWGRKSGL